MGVARFPAECSANTAVEARRGPQAPSSAEQRFLPLALIYMPYI